MDQLDWGQNFPYTVDLLDFVLAQFPWNSWVPLNSELKSSMNS